MQGGIEFAEQEVSKASIQEEERKESQGDEMYSSQKNMVRQLTKQHKNNLEKEMSFNWDNVDK